MVGIWVMLAGVLVIQFVTVQLVVSTRLDILKVLTSLAKMLATISQQLEDK